MTSHSQIHLYSNLTQAQLTVLRLYLRESYRLSRDEWRTLRTAITLLEKSSIIFQNQRYTFSNFYRRFIDAKHASNFLNALYKLTNVEGDGPARQAQHARAILTWLKANGFYGPQAGDASFLVVYSLYKWASFASGYVFQITIFRDLESSGIDFTPRDPRFSQQRYADHDLVLFGFKGDMKLSLYFLDTLPSRSLSADFYITQMYDFKIRRQRRIVIMHERLWRSINGKVIPDQLRNALQWVPHPVAINIQLETWILMDYQAWKAHILELQAGGRS